MKLESIQQIVESGRLFKIVYYGSSTTSFEHIFPNWGEIIRYVLRATLEDRMNDYRPAYWNLHTINLGLDGATSRDLLERFERLVLPENPSLVFLSMGKNDPYVDIPVAETTNNNRAVVKRLLERGVAVAFMTAVPSTDKEKNKKVVDHLNAERKLASDFSENMNFCFVDLYKKFEGVDLSLIYNKIQEDTNEYLGLKPGDTDTIHFNQYGNILVAKFLLKEAFGVDFKSNLFLEDLNNPQKLFPRY